MSTILFGYSAAYLSLLEALKTSGADRPIYLMPGDGRKGSVVRSVPIYPHQVNELTDFAMNHQAERVFLLSREAISHGAADDARAMGIDVIGPTAAQAGEITLKKLRAAAQAQGLPVIDAHLWPGPRAVAEKNALWPCRLLAPDGSVYDFPFAGQLKNAISRKALPLSGGEWLTCAPAQGEKITVCLYMNSAKNIPLQVPEGCEKWVDFVSVFLKDKGYEGFFTLMLRLQDGAEALERFEPLPATGLDFKAALPLI